MGDKGPVPISSFFRKKSNLILCFTNYDTCQVPVIFFYLTKKPPRQSLLRGGIIMFLNTFYQLLDVT